MYVMISVITYIAVNINSQEKRSGMVRGLYTAYTGLVLSLIHI